MSAPASPGLWIALIGAVLLVVGLLIHFGLLSWMFRLPGDLRFESERVRLYLPLATSLLLSVLLTLVALLFRR